MRPREIVVLPDGLTIERVALGLFELTFADSEGVEAHVADLSDLQFFIDEVARMDDR